MKTGTKIAIGIGGLVLVGGLIFLMTRKKDESLADSGPVEAQPDREEDDNLEEVGSEYGGRTIFDSGQMYPKMPQVKQPFKINQVVENKDENKDWTQDPYYYYF